MPHSLPLSQRVWISLASLPPCFLASFSSLNPRFSPFAVIPLPDLARSCYPCSMSATAQSLGNDSVRIASPPHLSQFPKWNKPPLGSLPFCADVERKPSVTESPRCPPYGGLSLRASGDHSLTPRTAPQKLEILLTHFYSATSKFLIDNFWPLLRDALARHSPPGTPHCISNRHTYEKLEILVSYTKQKPDLISNRKENALHPRRALCVPPALTKEGSAARDLFQNCFRGELT